jgi:hypothetical protein
VPAEQHAAGFGMHDERGRGDVQRQIAAPRVTSGPGQFSGPAQVGRLGLARRLVAVEQDRQRRPRGVKSHSTRWYYLSGEPACPSGINLRSTDNLYKKCL